MDNEQKILSSPDFVVWCLALVFYHTSQADMRYWLLDSVLKDVSGMVKGWWTGFQCGSMMSSSKRLPLTWADVLQGWMRWCSRTGSHWASIFLNFFFVFLFKNKHYQQVLWRRAFDISSFSNTNCPLFAYLWCGRWRRVRSEKPNHLVQCEMTQLLLVKSTCVAKLIS